MKFNNEILKKLNEEGVPRNEGLLYLLSLYYELDTKLFPNNFKLKMNSMGIITLEKSLLVWKIPLFEGMEIAFQWVETEYVKLFAEKNPDKAGHQRESIVRMKKFFSENPAARKQDVLGATVMYLSQTDPRFIREPHYFISKGRGIEHISDLLTWLDKYYEAQEEVDSDTNNIN